MRKTTMAITTEVIETKKKKSSPMIYVHTRPEEHAMLKLLCQIKGTTLIDYMTKLVKDELEKYRENLELLMMAQEEIRKTA